MALWQRRRPTRGVMGVVMAARWQSGVTRARALTKTPALKFSSAVLVFTIMLLSVQSQVFAESQSTVELLLNPSTCRGWSGAFAATLRDLGPDEPAAKFREDNSAIFDSRMMAVRSSDGGVVTGSLDEFSPDLTCGGYQKLLPGFLPNTDSATAEISLFIPAVPNSTSTLTLRSSTDEKTWTILKIFSVAETTVGTVKLPLQNVEPSSFSRLQLRLTSEFEPTEDVRAWVDVLAVRVSGTIAPQPSAKAVQKQPDETKTRKALDELVAFSKEAYKSAEHPLVTVPKTHVSQFLFFKKRPVEWKLEQVELIDNQGQRRQPTFSTHEIRDGASVNTQLNINPGGLRAGKYRVRVAMTNSEGGQAAIEKEFLWGVVALNVTHAVARPGNEQVVGMAVLDDEGRTICDAGLELTVTEPKGRKKRFSTAAGTVERSGVCVDKGVTNLPDYFVKFKAQQEGLYHLRLEAKTHAGVRGYEDTFQVDPSISFDVDRYDFPTRIYPLAEYPVRLAITPTQDYSGLVREEVPSDFDISQIGDARLVPSTDEREKKFIEWAVDWKKDQTYFLSYTFDAPDVSPALFHLGPLRIFSNTLSGNDFIEPRQWQLASDEAGSGAHQRLWMTGFENNTTTADVEYTANVGSPVIQTTTVRSGTYAVQANVSATTAGISYNFSSANNAAGYYFREYVRFTTVPDANTLIMAIRDSTPTNQASIRYDNVNNKLELWNEEDSAQIGSDSVAVTTGTWYRLEMRVDFGTAGSGNTIVTARLDGTEFATSTTVNWDNGVMTIQGGIITTNATANMFIDDVAINAASTLSAAGEGYPGDGKIIYLRPNGNGTNTAWTNDYLNVDEVTPNDATDVITCSASQTEDYTLTDATANGLAVNDTVKLAVAFARFSVAGTLGANYGVVLGDGTTFDTATRVVSTTDATYFTIDDTVPRNPTTSNPLSGNVSQGMVSYDKPGTDTDPWTPTDLDGAQVRIDTTDCSPVVSISTVWVEVEYVPASGGRLYSSGFELQSTTADLEYTANVNTPTISTTTVRSGAASLRANPSASTQGMSYNFRSADDATDTYFRSYIRFTTLPNANTLLMSIRDSGATDQASIRYDNVNNTLELWNEEDSVQIGSDSAEVTTGVWYRVEMRVDFGTAATGDTTVAGVLDGTSFSSSTTINWANGIMTLQLGIITTNATADVFFDDVAINQNAGTVQNGYPGAGQIVHLRPNANGDTNAWAVNVAGCTTTDYTCVDEVTPNDATDVVGSSTQNQIEEYNLDSTATAGIPSTATISLTQVGIRFNNSEATLSAVKLRLKDAASALPIESYYVDDTTLSTYFTNNETAPRNYMLTAYTRPHLTTAWTNTDLDAAQIGVRLGVDGSTNNFGVTAMWLVVEYTQPTISIAGSCDQFDQTTDCTNDTSNAIRVAVNGTLQTRADATVDGAWLITEVNTPTANDVITVFIDANADNNEAVGVGVYDGAGNISGLVLFQRHLTIGSADNQTLTNTSLSQYDNSVSGDEDIFFDVSAGDDLTVDSVGSYTDEELYVVTGNTFRPASGGGADVTTQSVELVGTWTADSNAINVAGDWVNSGTFTANTSTVTLNGTAAQAVTTNGQAYNALTLNNTGADGSTDNVTITGALDVDGDLTITNGDLVLTNNGNINTAGGVTIGSSAFVTKGTGTWTFDGTTAKTYTDNTATPQNIGAVTFNKTSGVGANDKVTLASSMTVDTATIATGDTLDLAASGYTLTLANAGATATVLTVTGTLTIGTSTIKYTATNSAGNITVNALSYSSLNLGPSSAETYDVAANQSASGTVTVDTNATMSIATGVTFTHSGATLTLNGTISGAGTYTYQSATTFPTGGTISSILRMDSTNNDQTLGGTRTYGGLVEAYNNSTTNRTLTLGSGASQTLTFSGAFNPRADNNGDVFVEGGTYNPTVNITGNLDFTGTGNGTEVLAAGDGTWTVSGDVNFTDGIFGPQIANLSPIWDDSARYNRSLSFGPCVQTDTYSCTGTTTNTFGANTNGLFCDVDGIEIHDDYRIGIEYNPTGINDSATILQAQLNPYVSTAIVGSNVNFGRSSADDLQAENCTISTGTYSKIGGSEYLSSSNVLGSTGTKIIDLGATAVSDIDSRKTGSTARLSIGINAPTEGSVLGLLNSDTATSNTPILRVGYVVNTTSTLVMNGTTKTLTSAGNTLYNLTLSGTITLANATHTVAGNFSMAGGTITQGTSTVVMSGAGKTLTGAGQTLNNLTIDPQAAGTVTLADSGVATDLTAAGTVNVASGDTLSIASSAFLLHSGSTLTLSGTISGAGTYVYQSTTAFPTTGTMSSLLRMDATNNNQTLSARTYGGAVELYNNSSAAARTITAGTAGSQTLTFSSDLTMNAANTQNLTLQGATWDPTVTITGKFDFTGGGSGTEIVTAPDVAKTWTVSGEVNLADGTWTASAETLKMDGTANLGGGGNTVKNLTIDGNGNTVTATGTDITVSGTLTIGGAADGNNDTLSIASGRTATSGTAGTVTFVASGTDTISGSGTLTVQNSNLDTDGTLSSVVRFDSTNGDVTMPARTYGGAVEAYNGHASTARVVTMGATTTQTLQSSLTVISNSGGSITLAGATNNPTVNLTGNLTYTKNSTGTVTVTSGTGTWTVSGDVNFTNGTYTAASGNTLVMNGTTKTLTSASQTLQNLTLSGSITLANATHTVAANFSMAGGTITAGTSTMTMTGTSNTLTGGGNTLNNLTIDPSSAGTITLQTSDLTVSGTLLVETGDTLSLNVSRSLTHTGGTLTLNGTISGSGTLVITDTSPGPGAVGGSTLSSGVRFDASNANIASTTLDARTYGGAVELYTNAAGSPSRTITFPTGTFVFSSTLTTNRANTGTITVDADASDPTITVSSTLTIGANTTFSASATGAFNVNGNYTNNGTFSDNLGTVTLAGSSQQTLSGTMTSTSNDFYNLTVTNSSGSDPDSSPSVIFAAAADTAGTFTAATANVKLRFNAGSTYAFTAINLNGQATSSRVKLRSSTGGTQFNFNAGAGSRAVSNTEVKDSSACGSSGGSIDASDGTNFDAGNNSCWTIHTISFSVSDNAIGFGSLSVSTGRWATGDELGQNADNGAGLPTAAHTLSVATSGTSGYVVTYNGATLTSGSNTISAATISPADDDGTPGGEQFALSASTSGNASITSGYLRGDPSVWNFVPSTTTTLVSESVATATETISLSYLANIANITEAGTYSTTITYVMTATY